MANRGHHRAHLGYRRGVDRILLALHRPTGSCVRERAVALRHEPPHPRRMPDRQQVVGPLGPQAVGRREITIAVTRVNRPDRGQLMNEHVRLGSRHGLRDVTGIQRVCDHRHRAQLAEHRLLRLAAGHAMNLMTRGNQTRLADRSCRTYHKHSHRWLPDRGIIYTTYDKTAGPKVTPPSTPRTGAATPLHAAGLQRRRAHARRWGSAARSPSAARAAVAPVAQSRAPQVPRAPLFSRVSPKFPLSGGLGGSPTSVSR